MGRPCKYDWAEVRRNYESGLTQTEIIKKLKVPKSSLSERIKAEKWVVNELANSIVKGTVKVTEQINELSEVSEQLAKTAFEVATEKSKDIDLIHDSSRFFLKKSVKFIQNDEDHTMQDLALGSKITTETGMNLGVIPRFAPKIDISNVNAQQTNTETKRVTIARRSDSTK